MKSRRIVTDDEGAVVVDELYKINLNDMSSKYICLKS